MAVGKSTSVYTDLPDALLEEAIRWNARMREPDLSDDTRMAFERWLVADERHVAAYEEAQDLWEMLQQPVAHVLEAARADPAGSYRTAQTRRARIYATVCLAVLLGFAVGWQTGFLDDLRSDYVTAVGARRDITLADGSQVTLNTDTAMAVDFEPDRRIVHLYRGEAWFAVTHDPERPFIVQTPEGNVRVTGTHFNVRLEGDEAILSLVEGRVELTAEDAPRAVVILAPGERGVIRARRIDAPEAFDVNALTAWQRGQLVFYQVPLAEVVEQLNRYRYGRIVLAASSLRSMKVTGVFDADKPDAALSVIENTLHISALHLTNYLIVLH